MALLGTRGALGCALIAAALNPVPASAETIYRSTGSDGEITYSAQPVPGAAESVAVDIPSLTPELRRAARRLRLEERKISRTVTADVNRIEEQWRQVDREIIAAQQALAKAESTLQAGREPHPGERRGNVGGGSRLTESYFRRLGDLESRVERARVRLARAYEERNALR